MDSYDALVSSYGLTSAETAAAMGLFGALAGMAMVFMIIGLIIGILLIIAFWKIFTKAGEKGWKSLIPIYSIYVYCKIIGITKWFFIWLGVMLASSLLAAVPVLGVILSIANFIVTLIFYIFMANNGAKAFGKTTGFAVGLFFLPNIFLLMLGFGSAEYKGVPTKE